MELKVESLTTTNALMKEDLAICKNSLQRAEEENRRLISQLEKSAGCPPPPLSSSGLTTTNHLSRSISTSATLGAASELDRHSTSSSKVLDYYLKNRF